MTKPVRIHKTDEQTASESLDEDLFERGTETKTGKIKWMFPDRVIQGAVGIFEGVKGCGKSTLLSAIAAAVTTGRPFLGRRKAPKASVLWLPGEEDVKTVVKPRLQSLKADMSRIHWPREDERGIRRRLYLPGCLSQLADAIQSKGLGLVIIDPLSSSVAADVSLTGDQSIHQVLDPLADLAHGTGCTILLGRNWTKQKDAASIDRGLGGAAVGGVARTILAIHWKGRPETRRVLKLVAGNNAGLVLSMEYHQVGKDGYCVLENFRELKQDEDIDVDDGLEEGEIDAREDAEMLLRRVLSAGWVPTNEVLREADEASVSPRTLRTVKKKLGVKTRRVGKVQPARWEWGPPSGGFPK